MTNGVVGDSPTRVLLFTGKGGVGKTTLACATAVQLADSGKRVLLVSTDPASNLDEVLETQLIGSEGPGTLPVPVNGASSLWALNIDPDAAVLGYKERSVGPYRDLLPHSTIASMEEQMAGACTVEIAVFDEFTRLLADQSSTEQFDHIIFDTAPTGHTLRLLNLPAAWTEFIASNPTGTSCLGALSGLAAQRNLYEASLAALRDGRVSTVILVSRPEASALREAERTRSELAEGGITNIRLALNGVFRAANRDDDLALQFESRMTRSLDSLPDALAGLERRCVPMAEFSPIGVARLREIFHPVDRFEDQNLHEATSAVPSHPLEELFNALEAPGKGVILTMGKGGVGKTTLAAAIATELARRGHEVHLTTTDPAGHFADAVPPAVPGLTVSRIDPGLEVVRYSEEVLRIAGADLDEAGKALLKEDLRSPCTEEIAVFRAFAEQVSNGEERFVVLDTAPTGHTLLLLDAAQAYHREVARNSAGVPESVRNLLSRLRDPDFTRVIIVTTPEATPVHEAARLQADLRRAGIEPSWWIVNQCLSGANTADALLRARANRELPLIEEVRRCHAARLVVVPWLSDGDPRGIGGEKPTNGS